MTAHQHKRKSNISVCHYHLCRKRTEVHKCKFCEESFCKEHINPKPPGLPHFGGTSRQDRLFMEEWQKTGGHPCMPFLGHWEAENKRKDEEYSQALDRLIKSKHLEPHHEPEIIHGGEPTRRKVSVYEKIENYCYYYKKRILKAIIIMIILSVAGYFLYNGFQSGKIQSAQSTISGWMTSPGHRQNILTATYDKEGIGIAISSDDEVLITQDFC